MSHHMSLESVSKVVDEQIRQWELKNKQTDLKKKYQPVITISRDYGSSGSQIGEHLAKKMGFSFWHQQLIYEMSQQTGLRKSLIKSLDEQSRNAIEDLVAGLVLGVKSTQKGYLKEVYRVIHALEKQGSAVVVGRGAQFVLKEKAFKVRFVASVEYRTRFIAKQASISLDEAEKKVKTVDQERLDFHQQYYGENHLDAACYNICLDVEGFSEEALVQVIHQAYNKRFPHSVV